MCLESVRGNETGSAGCDIRVGVHMRLTDERFRGQRRGLLHSEHRRPGLKYMKEQATGHRRIVVQERAGRQVQ
jgi:hypothetical protein